MQKAGVKSVAPQVMQQVADEVKTSMANSVSALSRLIEWTLKGVQGRLRRSDNWPAGPPRHSMMS